MVGCSGSEDIHEIRDQFFARQVEEILLNLDRFEGRTIQMEGLFMSWHDVFDTGGVYYFVIRFLSDCCGGGGTIGFELDMGNLTIPSDETWVQITGVLEVQDTWSESNPVLIVTAVQEFEEHGEVIIFS